MALRALLEEEEALKQRIKDRGQSAVAVGYGRRSSLGSDEVPKSSAARRDTIHSIREARRPSVSSDGSLSGTNSHLDALIKPTVTMQMRAAEKRQSIAPIVEEKPQLSPEELEEQRQTWEQFHHRNSAFQQTKDKFLDIARQKREEQEMRGCTFKPQRRSVSAVRAVSSGTMFDREQSAQIKKEQRLARLRQEKFDKEMAQCSFHPEIHLLAPREQVPDTAGSRRSSFSSCVSTSSSHRGYSSSQPAPLAASGSYAAIHAAQHYAASEGSEYYSNSRDEMMSQGSGDHQDSYDNADVTILPPGVGMPHGATTGALQRPPKIPGHSSSQANAAQAAFNERASEQLQALQRMQERKQLLEEAMTPDAASFASPSAPSFASPGAASFAAAMRRGSTTASSTPHFAQRRSAVVAGAVERMEALLCGDLSIDVEHSDSEWDDQDEARLEEQRQGMIDAEDYSNYSVLDPDDLGISPGAPLLKGKLSESLRSPSSPFHGGA